MPGHPPGRCSDVRPPTRGKMQDGRAYVTMRRPRTCAWVRTSSFWCQQCIVDAPFRIQDGVIRPGAPALMSVSLVAGSNSTTAAVAVVLAGSAGACG